MSDYVEETAKEADVLNEKLPVIELSTGQKVTIYKCKVKQIGVVLRFLVFLMKAIGMKNMSDTPSLDLSNPTELMILMANSSDEIYPVAVSLCSMNMEEFEDLEIDDAMEIMNAEWALNQSFFLQKVMPMIGHQTVQKSPTSKASRRKKSTRKRKVT